MARISPEDIDEIMDTEGISRQTLEAFAEDAHRVVEERCAPHTRDTDALIAVETYLAAHLACSKEPRIQSTSHESVSIEYAEEQAYKFWHRAILLDPTSRLSRPNGYPVYTT